MKKPTGGARKRGPSAELLAEMQSSAPDPTPDKLDKIRKLAREVRDIDRSVEDLEARINTMRERRRVVTERELVDIMQECGLREFTLEAEGNNPPVEFENKPYYHANIAVEWPEEKRRKAFDWIDKHHPGMLRNTISIDCKKNTRVAQKKIEALLKKLKLPYKNEFGVPWNTLTAFVREEIEQEGRTPPLELLGATVGRVVKIKKAKEK